MTVDLNDRGTDRSSNAAFGNRLPSGNPVPSDTGGCADQALLELKGDERWFCVHALAKKELFAAANLERQGFRCFVPKLLKTVRHARRTKTTLAPLFPRYLFTVIDLGVHRWRSIRGTFGVADLVMGDDRPRPVPVGVVEGLIEATGIEGSVDFRDQLQVGQEVRMLTGPFAEQMGRLARLDDNGRVAVLLEIMGAERLVRTERTVLQPVT